MEREEALKHFQQVRAEAEAEAKREESLVTEDSKFINARCKHKACKGCGGRGKRIIWEGGIFECPLGTWKQLADPSPETRKGVCAVCKFFVPANPGENKKRKKNPKKELPKPDIAISGEGAKFSLGMPFGDIRSFLKQIIDQSDEDLTFNYSLTNSKDYDKLIRIDDWINGGASGGMEGKSFGIQNIVTSEVPMNKARLKELRSRGFVVNVAQAPVVVSPPQVASSPTEVPPTAGVISSDKTTTVVEPQKSKESTALPEPKLVVEPEQTSQDVPTNLTEPIVSAIIPSANEGDELIATINSILEAEPNIHEIVVVENGPFDHDERLDTLSKCVKVITTDDQLGVGGGRNAGAKAATGNVYIFIDAHMRFDAGAFTKLGAKSLELNAWVCGKVFNRRENGTRSGASVTAGDMRFHRNRYVGYRYVGRKEDLEQVHFITGAFFACPASLFADWGEWDNTIGRWGYSEESQALRNFFLGRQMYCYKEAVGEHLYRAKNPYPTAGVDRWLNAIVSHYIYFSRYTFSKFWAPVFEKHVSKDQMKLALSDKKVQRKHKRYQKRKVKNDIDFFKDILHVQTVSGPSGSVVDVPRISVIIPACNEGDELLKTVKSVVSTSKSEPQVVVVNDMSDDGSVDMLRDHIKKHKKNFPWVTILDNKKRMGVDWSRNRGVWQSNGDIIIFTDAHTRWPEGGDAALAQGVIDKNGIICAGFQNFSENEKKCSSPNYGGHFQLRKTRALGNSYNKKLPEEAFPRIYSIIGSCYAMTRNLFERLGGWYEVPGARWGYSEQAMAWKVYFWDIARMYACRDVVIKHKVKKAFPYSITNEAVLRQMYFCNYVCWEEETYNKLWVPNMVGLGACPEGLLQEPTTIAAKKEFEDRRVKTDADFFDEVMPELKGMI